MGCFSGPDVVENSLVLALDAANTKGYDNDENLVTDNATDFNYSFNNQIISTANDVTPDGTTVLCKHDLTGATSPFLNCRANTTLNAGTYTMSMYLKGTTSFSGSFAFVGETVSEIYSNTANITTLWQRFTLTFTLINTQTLSRLQLFFATQGEGKIVSVLKAQLERGSVATDYTTRPSGIAKTRGTTLIDMSGRGNNGTLINGPTYNSANGGSLVFDGTNDYITSSFATTSGQAVTYAGWLYSTETTATYRNFVDSVTARPMIWWNNSGQIEFDAAFYTTTTVYRNQWVYVALSKPSGNSSASYYVNGNLAGTGTAYTTPAVTPTWFNRAAGQTWKGNCSNVQVYNRALTAQEIQQNFIATRSRFSI